MKQQRRDWRRGVLENRLIEECISMAAEASMMRRGTSIAYVGNVVDLWERLAQKAEAVRDSRETNDLVHSFVPDLGSDQTSCHIPFWWLFPSRTSA